MIHDLTTNHELIGLSCKEIKDILGQPESETNNILRYYLGMTGNYIDTGTLTLKLKDGRVDSYHISEG